MPRPQKSRRLLQPPLMKGFKPFGMALCELDSIQMTFEEYESLKFIHYDRLMQDVAAEKMNVSRPTFTRIYNKALRNITKAFIEGKAIVFEGGNYQFEKDWFRCKKCFKLINGLENHIRCEGCTIFGTDELVNLNQLSEKF